MNALARMISAVFRRGGDVSFVVEELKQVFDPRGGQWMERRYVPSLLAAIGEIIECHMIQNRLSHQSASSGPTRYPPGPSGYGGQRADTDWGKASPDDRIIRPDLSQMSSPRPDAGGRL